jgi:uncharacterized heparinase superfamily protein
MPPTSADCAASDRGRVSDDLFSTPPDTEAERQRLVRVDGDKGLSLTEKLAAAFHRLTYKTLVHRIRLRGRFPLKLIAVPEDPFAGDPVIAERLRAGKLPHAGHNAAARTCDFNDPQAPAQWRDWAHGFSWLRDLAADTPREEGAKIAEPIVARWLAAHSEFDELAWRPDLIGTRILFWTAYAPYILSSTDHVYRSAVLNALARWARHLDRAVEKMPDGMRRLQAIAGLIVAGLLIPGGEGRQARGEALLDRSLDVMVLPDGGILTRAPIDQLRLLELLLFVQSSYRSRALKPPSALTHGIERLVPSLKAAIMGDGGLGSWHGGCTVTAARLDAAITASGVTLRALRQGVDSGYQRLSSGRTLIVADAGPPPVARVAERAHTGTLAFEFSDGANRVIVNCGGADTPLNGLTKPLPPALAAALRTTAAHSTLVLADSNSTRIRPDGALGKGVEEVIANRQESEDGVWLDMVHDGYGQRYGLLHRRRLFVSANGQDVRGEDLLETAAGRGGRRRTATRFDIRFHLGAGVEATPTADAQGALLKLPDGRIWAFKARGATLSVDDSIWIDAEGKPRPTHQLVLTGNGVAAGTNVNWSFKRAGK